MTTVEIRVERDGEELTIRLESSIDMATFTDPHSGVAALIERASRVAVAGYVR